jgi:hypothetical protein
LSPLWRSAAARFWQEPASAALVVSSSPARLAQLSVLVQARLEVLSARP